MKGIAIIIAIIATYVCMWLATVEIIIINYKYYPICHIGYNGQDS